MENLNRHTMTAAEREEEEKIKKSIQVSTYLTDEFWESIHSGIKPSIKVPDYRESGMDKALSDVVSESQGIHMDFNQMFNKASDVLGPDQTKIAASNANIPRENEEQTFSSSNPTSGRVTHPSLVINRNQATAIKKYPVLIDFLGQAEGEKIANSINEYLNVHIAKSIEQNTKEAHEDALECKVDKQNFKQYFRGDGWICRVTASGPFRGDEVIYYGHSSNVACVLRKTKVGESIKYTDISSDFNIIFEEETLPTETTEVMASAGQGAEEDIKDSNTETSENQSIVEDIHT